MPLFKSDSWIVVVYNDGDHAAVVVVVDGDVAVVPNINGDVTTLPIDCDPTAGLEVLLM